MNLFGNIRIFLIDIDSTNIGSNAIVYANSVNNTTLQFRLVKNGRNYTLPDTAKILIKLNNVKCDDSSIKIINRFLGIFEVNLNSNLFMDGNNRQYELSIDVYNFDDRKEFEYYRLFGIKTSIMFASEFDNLSQASEVYVFSNTALDYKLDTSNFNDLVENYNNPTEYVVIESIDGANRIKPDNIVPPELLNSDSIDIYRICE